MSVHNFPKKVYVGLDSEDLFAGDAEYLYYTDLNNAEARRQVATYELVSVERAAIKLVKIKSEDAS